MFVEQVVSRGLIIVKITMLIYHDRTRAKAYQSALLNIWGKNSFYIIHMIGLKMSLHKNLIDFVRKYRYLPIIYDCF